MPGNHTTKQKRQAKHIVAGYKKRGVPMKTAKSIAWATVNKQQNESWMFNGAGQPVFMGNQGNVSQFDPGGTVSPGGGYIPDEVAKMLVKESGLRKLDTVSKKVIEGYLESMRLSKGLAVDVAKVLRDVYGITPTFDESTLYARSSALIEELTGVVSESFPMPFAVDDEPKELTEADIIGSFIQGEFLESKDEGYDVALAALATLSPGEFCDVVDFHEWVGPDVFNYIESIAVNGPEGAAEKVVEGLCWPHRVRFMPEHIQELLGEDAASVIKDFHAKRAASVKIPPVGSSKGAGAAKPSSKPGMKIPAIKKQSSVPSLKKQMSQHGKDLPSDPLAAKKPGAALAAHRDKQDSEWSAKIAAAKAKHADEPTQSVPQPSKSRMKRAGMAAIGAMKKAASHDVGPALRKIADAGKKVVGAAGGAAVKATGAVAKAGGHVAGATARGLVNGLRGKGGGEDKPKEKIGVLGHIGRAIGKFAGHVKQGFKDSTPGIQSQMPKGDGHEAGSGPEKKKDKKVVAPHVGGQPQEAAYRSGHVLSEVKAAFSGYQPDEDPEEEEEISSPSDVVAAFEADTVVDMAVLEAISEMNWDGVAAIAGFMTLEPDRFLSLIQSFKESRSVFRAEWNELEESGDKPSWMNVGSFVTLANLSLEEDVVPRLVYWAGRALQAADGAVAAHIGEAYPELGKTVYGPAGDPREGPELAKSFMTPHPAGTMKPTDSDCTTRMFSDPEDREKARKSKLADVMAALDGMRQAAADAGVPPEGMFLNLYRDMHREKVRYS